MTKSSEHPMDENALKLNKAYLVQQTLDLIINVFRELYKFTLVAICFWSFIYYKYQEKAVLAGKETNVKIGITNHTTLEMIWPFFSNYLLYIISACILLFFYSLYLFFRNFYLTKNKKILKKRIETLEKNISSDQ